MVFVTLLTDFPDRAEHTKTRFVENDDSRKGG